MHLPDAFRFSSCVGRVARGEEDAPPEGSFVAGGRSIVYAVSDNLFYATPKTMYSIFGNFFDASMKHYLDSQPPPGIIEGYRSLLAERRGLRPSCLRRIPYATKLPLRKDEQAGIIFPFQKKGKKKKKKRVRRRRLLGTLVSKKNIPSNKPIQVTQGEILFCGCKFSIFASASPRADHAAVKVPWKREGSLGAFQSEPVRVCRVE